LERQYEELRVNQEIQLMKHRKAQEDLVDKLNREKDALKDTLEKMNVLQHSIDQKTKKWKAMTHQVHEHERLVQELRLSVREKTDTIVELQDMTVKIQLKEEERFKSMFREAISNLQQELELKWTELEVQLETNTKHLVELISALDHVKKNHSIIIAQCNEKLSYMKMKHEQNVGELQKKIENLLHQGKLYDEMKQQVEEQYEQSQRRMISDYRQLQEQHQTLTNQLELVHEEMLQLQQSSKDFTTENALLKETLSQKKLEINRQIEKIHQLQGVINQKQEQINQYYQRLKVSDDLTRQLSQEKDAIQEERNDLQEKLLEKQFAFDALSTANQQLVEEKEAIVKRIGDDIRGQIKELERDIDKLSEEKGKVKQENQSLHQQVSQYEAERSKLREDLEKHLIQIRSLQDEHRQQEESHAKILIELNHEKGSLLQQLNETTANYIQAKQESAKLQKDFSNKMIEAQHLQDRLNIYKTEYRKQEREMAKMVGLFQQEFSSLQHQIADIAMFEVVRDDLPMEKPQNAGIQSVLSEPQKIILDDESPLKTSQRVSIIMEQQNETSTKNMTEPYHSTVENVATVPVLQNTIAAEANMLSPSRNKKKEQEKALEKEEVRELNYFDPLHPAPSTPLKNIIPSPSKQNSQPVDSHHVSRCIAEEDVVDIKSERPKSRSSIKQTSSDRSKTATKRVAKVNKVDAPPSPQSPKKRN
jgi:DNA repair exonuclease SbcCD ATPase subunit